MGPLNNAGCRQAGRQAGNRLFREAVASFSRLATRDQRSPDKFASRAQPLVGVTVSQYFTCTKGQSYTSFTPGKFINQLSSKLL